MPAAPAPADSVTAVLTGLSERGSGPRPGPARPGCSEALQRDAARHGHRVLLRGERAGAAPHCSRGRPCAGRGGLGSGQRAEERRLGGPLLPAGADVVQRPVQPGVGGWASVGRPALSAAVSCSLRTCTAAPPRATATVLVISTNLGSSPAWRCRGAGPPRGRRWPWCCAAAPPAPLPASSSARPRAASLCLDGLVAVVAVRRGGPRCCRCWVRVRVISGPSLS